MNPTNFPQSNQMFGPPPGVSEDQVRTIHAYTGTMLGGPLDGVSVVVVAWKPDEDDLKRLNEGGLLYLSVMGGLPPHAILTEFPFST